MNQKNKYIIDELEHTPISLPSDAYFEGLKQHVLNEIKNDGSKNEAELLPPNTEKSKKVQIIPMYRRWYVWGSAAAIGAFLFLFPWNNPHSSTPSEAVNLSSVSNEEIYTYLTENIEDLDAETIATHLSDDAVSSYTDPAAEKSSDSFNSLLILRQL